MAITVKSVGAVAGYDPPAAPNYHAPSEGSFAICMPCTENSGSSVANIGYGNTFHTDYPAFGATFAVQDGAGAGASLSTVTSGDEGPYLPLGTDARKLLLLSNATGSDVVIPRGTLIVRCVSAVAGAVVGFLRNNALTTADGFSVVWYTAAKVPGIIIRAGGVNYSATLAALADISVPHTIVASWGERGLKIWCDTLSNTATNAYTGGIVVPATTGLLWANASTAVGAVSTGNYGFWGMVGRQLDDWEVEQYLLDPWLAIRPSFALDTQVSTPCPVSGRVSGTSAYNAINAGTGSLSFTTSMKYRVQHGTDPYTLGNTSSAASATAAGDSNKQLAVEITDAGYAAGDTVHYTGEYSDDDGASWLPMPYGHGKLTLGIAANATHKIGFISDTHLLSTSGTKPSLSDGKGIRAWADVANVKLNAFNQCMRDIRKRDEISLLVCGGDDFHLDDATGASADARYTNMNQHAAVFKSFLFGGWSGITLWLKGNHEVSQGFQQNANAGTAGPWQRDAAHVLRNHCLNPLNGESEGDPTTSNSVSWVPALDATYDAAYRSTYCVPRSGVPLSPMGNYGYMDWGSGTTKVRIIWADPGMYTEPGDPTSAVGVGGSHTRAGPTWRYGAAQMAFIRDALAGSDAPYNIFVTHHAPGGTDVGVTGGTGYYGSHGLAPTCTEHQAILYYLALYNGIFISAHRHKCMYGHDLLYGVPQLFLPTVSAPSHSTGNGWPDDRLADLFGTPQSLGADTPSGGTGGGTALGIARMYNVLGYCVLTVTPTELRIALRQTAHSINGTIGSGSEVWNAAERYVGPVQTPAVADEYEASEQPAQVPYGALDSELTGEWWSSLPTDRMAGVVGDDTYDQAYADTTIVLSGVGTDDARVLHTPRELDLDASGEIVVTFADAPPGHMPARRRRIP